MQYQEYRALRDRILANSKPLRLDCMNLSKALSRLIPPTIVGSASVDMASEAWCQHFSPAISRSRIVITTGVRPALRLLFAHLARSKYELWLPEDVYPEYWRSAADSSLCARSFVTLPHPDLTSLVEASTRAALLLPHPLMPLGRYFTSDEMAFLCSWLGESSERRVILDAVYLFANHLDPVSQQLVESGQAFILHSMAKAWLLPDTLGAILAPQSDADAIRLLPAETSPEKLACGVYALNHCSSQPQDLAATFQRQWTALTEKVHVAAPAWQPPVTGYFSTIPIPFETLLREHHILAVPASVFGSQQEDLSVLTCLYYQAE